MTKFLQMNIRFIIIHKLPTEQTKLMKSIEKCENIRGNVPIENIPARPSPSIISS